MAGNSHVSAAPRVGEPGAGRPFEKGKSGNPSGRPKGIAKAAREALGGDPVALMTRLRDIALGEVQGARVADQISAARELLDRGYGKAPAFAAIDGVDPLELGPIEAEIQAIADALKERDRARLQLVKEKPAVAGSSSADSADG